MKNKSSMKKIFFIVSFLTISSLSISAQVNAKSLEILNKVSAEYQKSTSNIVNFQITIKDVQKKTENTVVGKIKTKQNKINIVTSYATIIFDGVSQYVYMPQTNEINISNPTKEDLAKLNPTYILNSYKKNYKINAPVVKTKNGVKAYSIDLFPESLKENYFKINININGVTYQPTSIVTYSKDGSIHTIKILKIEKNATVSVADFQFDAKKYPKAEIIDLR